jgi:Ca2+-binding EF-hand superfamily protein
LKAARTWRRRSSRSSSAVETFSSEEPDQREPSPEREVEEPPYVSVLSPTKTSDVVQVCNLAKMMRVQVLEMQQHFSLFREHAEVPEDASVVKDGRLNKEQFHRLVRQNLFGGSEVESDRSIDNAFNLADTCGQSALNFEQFVTWVINHQTFDADLNVDAEEHEMRSMAKEYGVSMLEVDRYRRLFRELDKDGDGRLRSSELEEMLHKCGSVPREIGLTASRRQSLWSAADTNLRGSIDFEEFLAYNLRYFTQSESGVQEEYKMRRHPSA